MPRTESRVIVPNVAADWLGQRREDFAAFMPLYEKGTMSVFGLTSKGLTTNRDAWIYGSSRDALANNVGRMIRTYTSAVNAAAEPTKDPRQISWVATVADAAESATRFGPRSLGLPPRHV
jgi:predicted helicase